MKKTTKDIYISEYTINDASGCRVYENGTSICIEDGEYKTVSFSVEQAEKIHIALGFLLKEIPE